MKLSYKDFRPRILLAVLAISVLIAAGSAVLDVIWNTYHQTLASHVISNLETMSRGVVLLQQDSVARVRKIADESTHKALVARLIADPEDPSIHNAFEAWITPLYQSRGFDDYSLISPDGKRVMTAGTRPYIGQLPLPSTRETLRRAELLLSGAVTPPISANHPFSTLLVENPAAYAYQLSCAPVDQNGLRMAFLCLHENPSVRLYRLLRDGRPGVTGEAYVVDQEGNILSPVRFEKSLARPEGAEPGWSLFQLRARVMPRRDGDGLPDPALISTEPLTRVVERLLQFDSFDTGLLSDYEDYRGRRVVGAARWLPDAALGLVVEEDMDEAFRSYNFARRALVALITLGSILILTLTLVDWRSRRSLARSEQRLAAFRDHIPAGMNMKSADGRYLMANPVFEASCHFPPGYVLGKTDAELFPEPDATKLQAEHEEVLRSGRSLARNYALREADGGEKTYSAVRFPVLDEKDGSVVAVGTVAMDISELIRIQRDLEELTQTLENKVAKRTEELAAARDLAESASRAKAEFLANMSHEIRTPLNAIIGMGYLADKVNADPQVGHYISRIQSSSRHLLGIVNDILDLSKFEAGKLQLHPVEFSLHETMDEVADLVSGQAQSKGLALTVMVAPGLPDVLIGDVTRISQILINFANNAVKFTESGRVVLRVSECARDADLIRLRFDVEDSGIGISEENIARLFRPFLQLDGSISRPFEGTGLGLAISRTLAGLMGGCVDVRSRLGEGSVFSLELPLRIGVAASLPMPPSRTDDAAVDVTALEAMGWLAGRSILLIEDNAINQEVMHDLLEMFGAQVTIAGDGRQGIQCLENGSFDLVLMDIHMPVLDGFAATAEIRRHQRFNKLPIVALTANALEGDQERCLAVGMNDYLAKPIQPDLLFACLKRLLDVPEGVKTKEELPSEATTGDRLGASDERIFSALSGIPGIHVAQAVSRMMGRRDLYVRLAQRLVVERSDLVGQLDAARQAGDHERVRDLVHGAKSLLGMLGADDLQRCCVDLQQQFADGSVEEGKIDRFAADLATLLTRLADAVRCEQA